MTTLSDLTRLTATRRAKYLPILVTGALLIGMYVFGATQYEAFGDAQVVLNLLIDNAYLLVVAIGMTFVILTGGIDLSVGAVIALSALVSASLMTKGWSGITVIPLVLVMGALLGFGMGAVIHYFELQPFIVTLAGMFLARGLCYTISTDSISITDDFFVTMAQTQIPLPGGTHVSISVLIGLVILAVAVYVLHFTRFGRTVYAIGGSEQSAMLMGLPLARTKIAVYTISGLCSAIGGVLFAFYTSSGDPLRAVGTELDAIAAVVIGGTILTGGSGYVLGTVLGVMVFGIIQILITYDGTLSSWWTKIVIGALLFLFIVLQRLVARRAR
jgi:ribose/xylose/arabinose/galactoside ABC-type transport system permease subunit